MKCATCTTCFYCRGALSPRHEHDHMPIPKEARGVRTVPACVNCHDLKDRVPVDRWPLSMYEEAFEVLNTTAGRLLLGKLFRITVAGEFLKEDLIDELRMKGDPES